MSKQETFVVSISLGSCDYYLDNKGHLCMQMVRAKHYKKRKSALKAAIKFREERTQSEIYSRAIIKVLNVSNNVFNDAQLQLELDL